MHINIVLVGESLGEKNWFRGPNLTTAVQVAFCEQLVFSSQVRQAISAHHEEAFTIKCGIKMYFSQWACHCQIEILAKQNAINGMSVV